MIEMRAVRREPRHRVRLPDRGRLGQPQAARFRPVQAGSGRAVVPRQPFLRCSGVVPVVSAGNSPLVSASLGPWRIGALADQTSCNDSLLCVILPVVALLAVVRRGRPRGGSPPAGERGGGGHVKQGSECKVSRHIFHI